MKVFAKDEWYISLSDFWSEIKKAKIKIALVALLFAALFFAKPLKRPLLYQAEAILVSSETGPSSSNALFQALQIETPAGLNDDVFTFLDSTEVMKGVVEKLDLQAYVCQPQDGLFKKIWRNLKVEGYYHYYKKLSRPPSQILHGNVLVADCDLFAAKEGPLACKHVHYDEIISRCLEITFLDETHFQVKEKKEILGEGSLEKPFHLGKSSFTLHGSQSLAQKTFLLALIPKEAAAKSLKESITIVEDTKKSNLTHIYYTHPDKILATSIVNELMSCYQDFVMNMGEEKIKKQLQYLEKRKNDTESSLEKAALMDLCFEMKKIASMNGSKEITISELISEIRKDESAMKAAKDFLSLEVTLKQLEENRIEYGKVEQKQKKYDLCLQKLQQFDFDVVEMVSILRGTEAEGHLGELENLNYIVNDPKTYTPKELEFSKQRIETKKQYLTSFLTQLIKACDVEKNILSEKIEKIKKVALQFLLEDFDLISNQMNAAVKNSLENSRVSYEKKIDFEKEFHLEMLKLLSDTIESKNLSLHLQSFDSYPFAKAEPSVFPLKPRLSFKFFVGFFFGAFLYIFALFAKTIYVGPKATRSNLLGAGYHFLDKVSKEHTSLKNFSFFLCDKRKGTLLLTSQNEFYPLDTIKEIIKMRGDSFVIIDFIAPESDLLPYLEGKISELEMKERYTFGFVPKFKEQLLKSKKFEELLESFKAKYDWVLLLSKQLPTSFETQILADMASYNIFLATNETLSSFSKLEKEKLYFFVERSKKEKELRKTFFFLHNQKQKSLKAIEPHLADLMKEAKSSAPLSFLFSLWSRTRARF